MTAHRIQPVKPSNLSNPRTGRLIAVGAFAILAPLAAAAAPQDGQACTDIGEAVARLACYDQAHNRQMQDVETLATPSGKLEHTDVLWATPPAHVETDFSLLSAAWELRASEKRGTFRLLAHKTNYLLPVLHTTRINTSPSTPSPNHSLPFSLPLDSTEAKFQLSFKVKAWENLLGDNGDLWVGYTQQSSWQVFNGGISAPFRETNYEPEAILSLRTNGELLGWRWRMLNLGFVHQSNGQPLPFSRSWNRVYAQFGLERGPFTLLLRPWYRLPEKAATDDNPDIRDYMGSGDVRLAYASGGHVVSALGRYSSSKNRGGLQAEWAFPVSGSLKGYVQLTSGYGASLIDYNHSQTTLGVGFLLLPWQ